MQSALNDFTTEFVRFIETGWIGKLRDYCEPGVDAELFNIYRNGYLRSVIDCLVSNYPTVYALLGDETFRHLSRQFVSDFPPTAGSLVGYGGEFAMFLDNIGIGAELPYLSDMARMDRAWLEVYFAADSEPLTPAGVTALINESGESGSQDIRLIPASAIVFSNYPLSDVWQQLKDSGHLDKMVKLDKKPEQTLLWRAGPVVQIRALPATEGVFFSGMHDGLSIEEAAGNVIQEYPDFDIGSFFSSLIAAGLLSKR